MFRVMGVTRRSIAVLRAHGTSQAAHTPRQCAVMLAAASVGTAELARRRQDGGQLSGMSGVFLPECISKAWLPPRPAAHQAL